MSEIVFALGENDLPTARDRLNREIERLEVGGKREFTIYCPESFAIALGIAEHGSSAAYSGHAAEPNNIVPYLIRIEWKD